MAGEFPTTNEGWREGFETAKKKLLAAIDDLPKDKLPANFRASLDVHHGLTIAAASESLLLKKLYADDPAELIRKLNSPDNLIVLSSDGKIAGTTGTTQHLSNHPDLSAAQKEFLAKANLAYEDELTALGDAATPEDLAALKQKVHHTD